MYKLLQGALTREITYNLAVLFRHTFSKTYCMNTRSLVLGNKKYRQVYDLLKSYVRFYHPITQYEYTCTYMYVENQNNYIP